MPRVPSKNSGPGVADLIEESVHLLRKNPRELIWYYAGTGPFAVALLYFWGYVTWFAPADGEVAAGALLLGVWQKIVCVDFDDRPRTRKVVVQLLGE